MGSAEGTTPTYRQYKLAEFFDASATGEINLDVISASIRGWVNHMRNASTVGRRKRILARLAIRPPSR